MALKFVAPELRESHGFVCEAVARNGEALAYVRRLSSRPFGRSSRRFRRFSAGFRGGHGLSLGPQGGSRGSVSPRKPSLGDVEVEAISGVISDMQMSYMQFYIQADEL